MFYGEFKKKHCPLSLELLYMANAIPCYICIESEATVKFQFLLLAVLGHSIVCSHNNKECFIVMSR